jgi:chromosome segregation ATPase
VYYYKLSTLYKDKMDIKQNHYSTDFETGAIRVDRLSDSMSSDSDTEVDGHCKKVTKRKATYESNIATEHGLIELGKHMSANENYNHKRSTKYLYLVTSVKELDDFNGSQFLREVSNCKDKNLITGKIQSLVGYISMFKELYNHHAEDISDLNKEVESLKVENADMLEIVDKYIDEIDEGEAKLAKIDKEVIKYKGIFAVHEEKLSEYHGLITQHQKTIIGLTTDNQIYDCNEKIHYAEKRNWNNQKVSLDNIVLRQHKIITQLKNNATRAWCFTRNFVYFSIGCGIIVVGSAMYSMTY